jgi:hypothetical protein
MYRKYSIKTLSSVFAALLIVVIGVNLFDSRTSGNTLKDILFEVNEDQVSTIKLYPRSENGQEITLVKNGSTWSVSQDGSSYNGDQNLIGSLVDQINGLKPLRLAATKKDKWSKYEVNDSLATRVVLENNGEVLADIMIGKFSYIQAKNQMPQQNPYMQQPRGIMNTYVRLSDEDEVYAVEGFLSMSFNRNLDAFRDKTVLNVQKDQLSRLTFSYPADSSFVLSKRNDAWFVDELPADSAAVANYLNGLSRVTCNTFSEMAPMAFTHRVKVEGNSMEAIDIQALISNEGSTFQSSQNKGTNFSEKDNTVLKKVLIGKSALLK